MMDDKSDNEIIAEFMGFYKCRLDENSSVEEDGKYIGYTTKENPTCGWFKSELHYDSDWNWLMEVVDKIDSLPEVKFVSITKNKTRIWMVETGFTETPFGITGKSIIKCHAAIVEFIKLLNSQK